MFENNIKQHYVDFVERFVNVFWDKKNMLLFFNNSTIFTSSNEKKRFNIFVKLYVKLKTIC